METIGHRVHFCATVAAEDEDFATLLTKRGDFLAGVVAGGFAEAKCGERLAVARNGVPQWMQVR